MTDPSNDDRFRRDLPDALVLLRQARGLSQKELADRLGLDPSVLSRYEHGVAKAAAWFARETDSIPPKSSDS